MANTLRFKRGLVSTIPTALAGEPLFTTDTFDLYIGNGTGNTRFQKYIASGTTSQLLRGDGSLLTMPIVLTSPATGQVLKFNGTNWVNDSDAGITGSGANGQVAFFTGATTQGGSNNLFWDATNSRLGIGTNTPTSRLHVTSTAWNSTDPFISFVNLDPQGVESKGLYVQAGANTNASYISNFANFSGTSVFYLDGLGNLGLKTTSPTHTLDVADSARFRNQIRFATDLWNVSHTDSTNRLFFSASGSTFFGTASGYNWQNSGGTNIMSLFGTGNLVLNSTTDNGLRFQVTGDGFFSGSVGVGTSTLAGYNFRVAKAMSGSNVVGIGSEGVIDGLAIAYYFNTSASTANTTFTLGNLYHYAAIQGTRGAASTITSQFGFFVDSTLVGGVNNYGFYGNIASGTGRWNLYMNGTAANYLNGNLGVGITAPTARVEAVGVSGTTLIRATAADTNGNADVEIRSTGTTGSSRLFFGDTAATSGSIIYNHASDAMLFSTAATTRATLDASGNLGLGVTPSAWGSQGIAFQMAKSTNGAGLVNEHFSTGNTSAGNSVNIGTGWIRNTSGTIVYSNSFTQPQLFGLYQGSYIWYNATSGTAGQPITFTQAMTLFATGNLAIGTGGGADAGFRLDVNGTMRVSGASTFGGLATISTSVYPTLAVISSNSIGCGMYLRATGTSGGYFTILSTASGAGQGAGKLVIVDELASATRFTIDSTGAATFSSSVTATSFNGTTNNIFSTGGTERMRLDASGNLGLGTSPVTYTVGARGINILSSSTAAEISLRNSTTGNASGAGLILTQVGVNGFIYNANAGILAFGTSDAERARFTNGGNFLLGTTTDAGFKLDVNGTMRVSGASTFQADINLNKTNASLAEFIINDGFTSSTTTEGRLRVQANSTQGYFIANGPLHSTYKIQGPGDVSIYKSGTDGNITILNDRSTGNILMAAGGSSTAHFTIASTGAATFSSTIAVGGTATFLNPSSVNIVGTSTLVGATARNTSAASGDTQAGFFVENGTSNGQFYKAGTGYTTRKTIAANDLGFYNAAAGNISILNDFASGSIILTAGGSSTAQWTIGANGDLTAADGENIIVGSTNGTKIGTASTQKIGFWNATPIVQPNNSIAAANFVAGIGTNVTTLDAFDGYTIGQVVKALRNAGILS